MGVVNDGCALSRGLVTLGHHCHHGLERHCHAEVSVAKHVEETLVSGLSLFGDREADVTVPGVGKVVLVASPPLAVVERMCVQGLQIGSVR